MVNMRNVLALSVLSLLAQAVPSPTQQSGVSYLHSGNLGVSDAESTSLHQFQKRQTCYTFFWFWRWCFADDDPRDVVTTTFNGQAATVTLRTVSTTSTTSTTPVVTSATSTVKTSSLLSSSSSAVASSSVQSSSAAPVSATSSRASSSAAASSAAASSAASVVPSSSAVPSPSVVASSSSVVASSSSVVPSSSTKLASSSVPSTISPTSSSTASSSSSSAAVISSSIASSSSSVTSSSVVSSGAPSSVASSSSASSSSSSAAVISSATASSSSASSIASSSRAPSSIASSSSAVSSSLAVSSSTPAPSSSAPASSSIPLQISSIVSSVVSSVIPTPSSKWTSPTLPNGWVAVPGCIAEGSTGRALTGSTYGSASMTPEACIAYCNVNGYSLAGVEYGSECFCGNEYANGAAPSKIAKASCDMPCSGDATKLCAGPSALNIFSNTLYTAPKLNLPAGWAPSDPLCIAEVPGRALSGSFWAADNMTVDVCVSYCSGRGFPLAAVEYGRECMCGTKLVNGASFDRTSTGCSMPCAGSSSSNRQICGGSNAVQVYFNSGYVSKIVLPTGWESLGCIAEGTQGRALISDQWESDSMTIDACLTYCSSRGYGMAGLEYGRQCFCAKDSLSNGASLAVTSNQCIMPCSGSILLPCGGAYAVDLYQNPAIASAVKEVASAVGKWKDSGLCLQEVQGRALRGAAVSSPGMNVEYCLNYCGGLGFLVAGVEYGKECYCGQKLEGGASVSLQSGQCKMPCSGNTEQICGGPNALNLYTTDSFEVTVSLPTGWSKIGCVAEPNGHRALNVSAFDVSKIQGSLMTGVACARACSSAGYTLAATQYSQECRCGNALNVTALNLLDDSKCDYACSGNLQEMCGSAYKQTLFSSSPTVPLVNA